MRLCLTRIRSDLEGVTVKIDTHFHSERTGLYRMIPPNREQVYEDRPPRVISIDGSTFEITIIDGHGRTAALFLGNVDDNLKVMGYGANMVLQTVKAKRGLMSLGSTFSFTLVIRGGGIVCFESVDGCQWQDKSGNVYTSHEFTIPAFASPQAPLYTLDR
jgi:hypothetical protein